METVTMEKLTPQFVQEVIKECWGLPSESYQQTFASQNASLQAAFLAVEKYCERLSKGGSCFYSTETKTLITGFIDGYLSAHGVWE
jgi:hypothetical protein